MAPGRQIMRSWPWTIALAGVVTGFVLIGMVGLSLRSSWVEVGFSLVVILGGLVALYRVLTSGVHVLPSGLIVRELTRSTPVPWPRIRSITTAATARKGVYAPVLLVGPARERAGAAERSGARARLERGNDRLELTILAAYSQAVAQRRTEALVAARRAHTS
jgi:hypothetical protein